MGAPGIGGERIRITACRHQRLVNVTPKTHERRSLDDQVVRRFGHAVELGGRAADASDLDRSGGQPGTSRHGFEAVDRQMAGQRTVILRRRDDRDVGFAPVLQRTTGSHFDPTTRFFGGRER